MPFADVIDSCGHPTPRARVFLTLPPSPFQIEFIANTIIFVLAGLIIGNNFLALDDIGGKEWGYLVVLYIFVYLIRLTIVSLFYPLLMRLGYGLSMKEGAVVVHGGLRGAVGLALAIRVQEMSLQGYQDGLDYDLTKNDGNRILFFVGGIAVLTLLVQATTTEALMRRMGMFVLSMGTKRTQEETMVSLQDKAFETYKDNYSDPFIGEAIPAIVARLVPNISISELVTVSENSDGDGEKNSGARATVHETEEYAELRGRLARVNSVQLHEDAKKPEASPSPSKLSRKMSAKLVRAETIQEPSTGEKTMSDRRTAILTEEDLLSFGAPSWLTLEAIRPYLADLEVRFLNGVLSAYKKMREKNIITSRTELILHQRYVNLPPPHTETTEWTWHKILNRRRGAPWERSWTMCALASLVADDNIRFFCPPASHFLRTRTKCQHRPRPRYTRNGK